MAKIPAIPISHLRGVAQLATRTTLGTADLIEAMHHTVAAPWSLFSKQPQRRMHGLAGLVYKTIRGGTRVIGGSADALLGAVTPIFPNQKSRVLGPQHAALLSVINGVIGDDLAATRNPLAIEMELRLHAGFKREGGRLIVLVHGLCMNDQQWLRAGHDHGVALAKALGATPIYAHYNTGLHIADNGVKFAAALEALIAGWPEPVTSLTIVAHSMGGLVTRSACHVGEGASNAWLRVLKNVIFLGTPHAGAPLERGGHWIDLLLGAVPYSAPFARIGKIRSAGITDLRDGNLGGAAAKKTNEVLALPKGVRGFAIAASLGARDGDLKERLLGDGLVPIESALGPAALAIPKSRQWLGHKMGHLDLLSHPEVMAQMLHWLAPSTKKV